LRIVVSYPRKQRRWISVLACNCKQRSVASLRARPTRADSNFRLAEIDRRHLHRRDAVAHSAYTLATDGAEKKKRRIPGDLLEGTRTRDAPIEAVQGDTLKSAPSLPSLSLCRSTRRACTCDRTIKINSTSLLISPPPPLPPPPPSVLLLLLLLLLPSRITRGLLLSGVRRDSLIHNCTVLAAAHAAALLIVNYSYFTYLLLSSPLFSSPLLPPPPAATDFAFLALLIKTPSDCRKAVDRACRRRGRAGRPRFSGSLDSRARYYSTRARAARTYARMTTLATINDGGSEGRRGGRGGGAAVF